MQTKESFKAELTSASDNLLERLWKCGLRSKSDIVDILQSNPEGRDTLIEFLQISGDDLLSMLGLTRFPEHSGALLSLSFGLGALAPQRVMEAVTNIKVASLPKYFSLASKMQPVRNQGNVGTCTAFGTISVLESQIPNSDFSERFLYYYTKENDGHPDSEGSYVRVAISMLAKYGSCLERSCVYVDDRDALAKQPEPSAVREAEKYRPVGRPIAMNPKSVDQFKAQIAGGRGVAFSVPIFNSSKYSLRFNSEGRFIMRLGLLDKVAGWHAMGAVGFFDNDYLLSEGLEEAPGGGIFLVRNSWGTEWARNNPVANHDGAGSGYALIPYDYIAKYCGEAYTIVAKKNRSLFPNASATSGWWSNVATSVVSQSQSRLAEVSEFVRAK